MRGRFASGILNRLGMPQMACNTNERYIEMAVELIQNPSLLHVYKTNIATQKSKLFNDLAPIRDLEKFLVRHLKK